MKSIALVSVISSVLLCASLIACGDDDSNDNKDSGGAGGSTQQQNGAGGDQQQDSGTDSNTSASPCDRICDQSMKAACPKTTREDCMSECNSLFSQASGKCTAEINAVVDCVTAEPFTCNDTGKATPSPNCNDKQSAVMKCETGSM